jgi:uncharacterized protein YbcI
MESTSLPTDPDREATTAATAVPPGRVEHGALAASISTAMVRIYAECYGRGPTKARTHVMEDNVLVVLEGIYTQVERTLAQNGESETVREVRRRFQRAIRDRFISEIERLTGRRVRAFLSETSVDPDIAVEVFVLEPLGD